MRKIIILIVIVFGSLLPVCAEAVKETGATVVKEIEKAGATVVKEVKKAGTTVVHKVGGFFDKKHEEYVEKKDPYVAFTDISIKDVEGKRKTDFFYNLPVAKPFVLSFEIMIINEGFLKRDKIIEVAIKLPLTKVLDVSFTKGPQDDKPEYDYINETQTYRFHVRSRDRKEAQKYGIDFLCTPLKAGLSKISVTYDDNVSAVHDKFFTLRYVN